MEEPGASRRQPLPGRGANLLRWLRQPVDGASLAVFRMLFGFVLLVDVFRYWDNIEPIWLTPLIRFTYYGFDWVRPWPGDGLYWHFAVMGLAAACIMLGFLYRLAAIVFFLAFSYMFLLEQTAYLNHFYLVVLLGFLMCWLPAQRTWALDARRLPAGERGYVPRWAPLSLMLFMEVLLIYAGLVKINADWLQGYPLKFWFLVRADWPVVGVLLRAEWFAVLSSYLAIALHVIGAPLLFFRKTRLAAFAAYVLFHLSNSLVWSIGIFPYITIAGTLMFFAPDWPRVLARKLMPALTSGDPPARAAEPGPISAREGVALAVIAVFLAYNILMPMRPLVYPGNVAWTEEGHRFSWRMKLRSKQCDASFNVHDPATGKRWKIEPDHLLTPPQLEKFASSPDMVLQFVHRLAPLVREKFGLADPEIRALVQCSLNGRPYARLVDPRRDLLKIQDSLLAADWILPLDPNLEAGARMEEIRAKLRKDGRLSDD